MVKQSLSPSETHNKEYNKCREQQQQQQQHNNTRELNERFLLQISEDLDHSFL